MLIRQAFSATGGIIDVRHQAFVYFHKSIEAEGTRHTESTGGLLPGWSRGLLSLESVVGKLLYLKTTVGWSRGTLCQ